MVICVLGAFSSCRRFYQADHLSPVTVPLNSQSKVPRPWSFTSSVTRRQAEIYVLKQEVEKVGVRAVVISGDIGDLETSRKVNILFHCQWGTYRSGFTVLKYCRCQCKSFWAYWRSSIKCPFSDFLSMPLDTWERTRQVNLDGTFYIVQGVVSLQRSFGHDNDTVHVYFVAVSSQMKALNPQDHHIFNLRSWGSTAMVYLCKKISWRSNTNIKRRWCKTVQSHWENTIFVRTQFYLELLSQI